MIDGVFRNPTTIFFGKDAEKAACGEIKNHSRKILLHYGQESFKKYGLHAKLTGLLASEGVAFVELGGVASNPVAALVYEGIDLCRMEKIDFILAAGGGSVIDSAKAIAVGVPYGGDFFDFYRKQGKPQRSLKVGAVLTVAGAGSESGSASVITGGDPARKLDCESPLLYPVFAALNPELTYTVPQRVACSGIVDAISHVLEAYFSNTEYVDCSDRLCEGIVLTLMKYAEVIQADPRHYGARAEVMWASKLAHDNTVRFGRKQDWACHMISHEIGACCHALHGEIIAVVLPSWMELVKERNTRMVAQFARRVLGVAEGGDALAAANEGIRRFRVFLASLGMPASLSAAGFREASQIAGLARNCAAKTPSGTIGNYCRLSEADIRVLLDKSY